MNTAKPKFNVHQAITDQILEAMQSSDGTVKLPWHHNGQKRPINVVSRNAYRGANPVLLWMSTVFNGYTSNEWGTFKQWTAQKGTVREGEKSTMIMFYKKFRIVSDGEANDDQLDEDDNHEVRTRMFARAYRVFNRCQIDGLDAETQVPVQSEVETIDHVEDFVRNTEADVRIGGGSAYFYPAKDFIRMPDKHLFTGDGEEATLDWYAVLLHELSHWTGAKHRLNRASFSKPGGNTFGGKDYAFEELVAELGSAFLCADLGLSPTPREDHAHYLKHWISHMQNDKCFFTRAATKAQAASEYLAGLQTSEEQRAETA